MNRQELLQRTCGLNRWMQTQRHHPFYKGVAAYQKRLLELLYQSKVTN